MLREKKNTHTHKEICLVVIIKVMIIIIIMIMMRGYGTTAQAYYEKLLYQLAFITDTYS